MANTIYRGPSTRQPLTVNLPVAGAYVPGTFVSSDLSELTQITSAAGNDYLILSNVDFYTQTATDAYTSGDTAVAYKPEPQMEVQASMAAATYAYGDELTIAASGRLAAATSGDMVVAFFDQAGGAVTAGALADVRFCNTYIKA